MAYFKKADEGWLQLLRTKSTGVLSSGMKWPSTQHFIHILKRTVSGTGTGKWKLVVGVSWYYFIG